MTWPPSRSPTRSEASRLTGLPGSRRPSAVRASVSGTTSKARGPSASITVRQTPATATESPTAALAAVSAAATTSRESSKETTVPSSRTIPVNMRQGYGSCRYASNITSSPEGSARTWSSSRRASRSPRACGPAPARTGATNRSSLSTRPAARNAVASVGPPSSRSDWTPSAASARSSSSSGPVRSSSSDPAGSGPRPKARRRGWREASTSRASRRGASARTGPTPTPPAAAAPQGPHADRDGVRSRAQPVHSAARVLPRHPAAAGNGDAPVEGDRRLVGDEGAVKGLPDAPRLVLAARGEVVDDLDLDSRGANPLDAATVDHRVGIAGTDDDARRTRGHDRVRAGRRAPVVRARLERDVEDSAPRGLSCLLEGDHLRVADSLVLVPAL